MKKRMATPGERLRRARIDAGYRSASSAAKLHGWTISTFIAHENGQNHFDAAQAEIYAKAFKTQAEFLMFGRNINSTALPGIDRQLLQLPADDAKALIEKFNAMIEGVRIVKNLK